MENNRTRVYLLDILRGAAVIGMVGHHALVSYEIVFGQSFDFLYSGAFAAVQLVFVAVFLLVSGICTQYSRSVLKRGLVICAAAALVSIATCLVLPLLGFTGLAIYFGILHMFGFSMVLYALLKKPLQKIPPFAGFILFTTLFAAYYAFYRSQPISDSAVEAAVSALPRWTSGVLRPILSYFFMMLGIQPSGISYGDYYPLFPFSFLFLAGTYVGQYVRANRFPHWFYAVRCRPLELFGRYSLWVYLLHQPVIFGTMYLICMLLF